MLNYDYVMSRRHELSTYVSLFYVLHELFVVFHV